MRAASKVCGTAISIVLGACLFSPLAQADVLACRGASGTVTYTNGQCEESTRVKVVIFGARPVPVGDEQQVHHVKHGTGWTRPLKIKNRRPDVASIRAAKLELQRMDAQRQQRKSGNGAQLAQYQEQAN
ncbi:MAG TPA: DUF4124 domain-containing protein [Oxalicibacterium sp.]|jgi:hypothetical protein|nr:DUF4124 domain-containing protein [Oxalicibacterium sp.]